MHIQDAYTDWSNTYDEDRNLTRDLDLTITKNLLANLRPETILEIGCGTGKNTTFLTKIGRQIYALDFSSGMIKKASEKFHSEKVAFTIADLTRTWPCKAGTTDLVVCNLVLEHIQDLSFVFSEVSRSLKNSGHFFLSELHPFRQYLGTRANYRHNQESIEIPAFTHHISDFMEAAAQNGLSLVAYKEEWHEDDHGKPPRLAIFLFKKSANYRTSE